MKRSKFLYLLIIPVAWIALTRPDKWESHPTGARKGMYDICFADADHGWIVGGDGRVFSSDDGGRTWEKNEEISEGWFRAVEFIDASTGWIVGSEGLVLATKNGGQTWTRQDSGTTNTLKAIDFVDRQTGWALGGYGTILRTLDGGERWESQTSEFPEIWFNDVSFFDRDNGWVVGEKKEGPMAVILRTKDGGQTWKNKTSVVKAPVEHVSAVGKEEAWIESFGVFRTLDGGDSWELKKPHKTYRFISDIEFLDEKRGWIAEFKAFSTVPRVYSTDDGGDSWRRSRVEGSNVISTITRAPDGAIHLLGGENTFTLRPENQPEEMTR